MILELVEDLAENRGWAIARGRDPRLVLGKEIRRFDLRP